MLALVENLGLEDLRPEHQGYYSKAYRTSNNFCEFDFFFKLTQKVVNLNVPRFLLSATLIIDMLGMKLGSIMLFFKSGNHGNSQYF